jgi:hypothetical protein
MAVKKRIKERKMKKFSWIFALILALSIGFIGCPEPEPAKTGGGGSGDPGDPPFVPNEKVTTEVPISITAENTLFDESDGSANGSVDFITGGYRYTFSTTKDMGYGHAAVRFSIDLGEDEDGTPIRLGDFGGVGLKWKGISGDVAANPNITYTKNVFVLASDEEAKVTPYLDDAALKSVVVNTKYYETAPANAAMYDGAAGVPAVRALFGYPENQKPEGVTEPYEIATPILRQQELTGLIWLVIYLPAEPDGGIHEVTDVKLIPHASFVKKDPPPPPEAEPPAPAAIPANFQKIELDLGSYMTTGDAVSATVPSVTKEDPAITVAFTLENQRINIPLTTAQKTVFNGNLETKDVYVQIDCEIVGTDNENKFRYHIGIVDTTSNWNVTDSLNGFPLLQFHGDPAGVAVSEAGKGVKINASQKGNRAADYFILQHLSKTAVTVKINSITIWVPPALKYPSVTIAAADIKGNADTVVTAITGGAKVVNTNGYESGWIYFKVKLASGRKLSDYVTLSFTIKSITPTDPPAGSTDLGGYKTASIYAFDDEPTIANIKVAQTGDEEEDYYGQLKNLPKYKIGGGASSGIAGIQNPDQAYNRDAPIALPDPTEITDDDEFWIAYFVGGSKGYTYEITNIKLVSDLADE